MNTVQYLVLKNQLSWKGQNLLSNYFENYHGEEYIFIIAMLLTDLDLPYRDREIIRAKLINNSVDKEGQE